VTDEHYTIDAINALIDYISKPPPRPHAPYLMVRQAEYDEAVAAMGTPAEGDLQLYWDDEGRLRSRTLAWGYDFSDDAIIVVIKPLKA